MGGVTMWEEESGDYDDLDESYDEMLDNDEISPEEYGFMRGWNEADFMYGRGPVRFEDEEEDEDW
jgi:hypothetical protein